MYLALLEPDCVDIILKLFTKGTPARESIESLFIIKTFSFMDKNKNLFSAIKNQE